MLTVRAIPGTLPAIGHARGLLLLARGEVPTAYQALQAASESWQVLRRFWEGTWARLDLAEAAARARRRGEAAVLANEVRTIAATTQALPFSPLPPIGSPNHLARPSPRNRGIR